MKAQRYERRFHRYTGDGITGTYPFHFRIFTPDDLQVWVDGEVCHEGYYVTGLGRENGGSISFVTPPAQGSVIVLKRHLLIARKAEIMARGQVSGQALRMELEHHLVLMQQLEEQIDRSVVLPVDVEAPVRPVLPVPQPGQIIGWSEDGRRLVNGPDSFARLVRAVEELRAGSPPDTVLPKVASATTGSTGALTPGGASKDEDSWKTADLVGGQASWLSDESVWAQRVLQRLHDRLYGSVASASVQGSQLSASERFGPLVPSVYMRAVPDRVPYLLKVQQAYSATRVDRTGRVVSAAADAVRDDFSPDGQTYLGWHVEGPAKNLLGMDTANLLSQCTATRIKIFDGTAPATARVLEASAADGILLTSRLEASGPCVFSLWIGRVKGTGAISLTCDGGTTWVDITDRLAATGMTRVHCVAEAGPIQPGIRIAQAYDAVVVDWMQCETGRVATSAIVDGPQGAFREADVLKVDDIGIRLDEAVGSLYIEVVPGPEHPDPQVLFSSAEPGKVVEASVDTYEEGISVNLGSIASGFGGKSKSGIPVREGVPLRFALGWSDRGIVAVQDGVVFQMSRVGKPWTCTALALGCQLRNGPTRFLYGWVRRFALFPERLSDDHLMVMTRS
ncbi:hypothetical protein HEQ60_03365 [Haematospirillum sp. H1815]|uniref:phage head spike fiber domain-containing protein n=1 Tax=Haematospirillum sp. H1815 TaxID=2723108 RepID=UPI001439D5D5|nr:hypothetical protein [Haematospirillum sp. H1815]NKD76807.1 hypothetical protein [Haematospirillum sp. H1815]